MPPRSLHIPIVLLLLAFGVLLSATTDRGAEQEQARSSPIAPLDPATFSITSGGGSLLLQGTTVSSAHEATLLQLTADHFAAYETQTEFGPGVILADGWEPASSRLLYVLATTMSAQAVMRDRSIEIRGVTSDAEAFAARLKFLRDNLDTNVSVITDIIVVESTKPFDEMCEKAFAHIPVSPISFRKSSTEIPKASFATLDRITDFAHDCQRATISIAGHSDASGDESWNRQLSLARAQAVADHLVRSGIAPERLLVNGLGSAEPVADNTTAHGRSLNRRIDFELD